MNEYLSFANGKVMKPPNRQVADRSPIVTSLDPADLRRATVPQEHRVPFEQVVGIHPPAGYRTASVLADIDVSKGGSVFKVLALNDPKGVVGGACDPTRRCRWSPKGHRIGNRAGTRRRTVATPPR